MPDAVRASSANRPEPSPIRDRAVTSARSAAQTELRPPQIVKSNGTREDFSETKLREGFRRALHKRPVSTELADAAVDRIRQRLLTLGEREVPAREVGELVMSELKKLDKIAYIRFASVYKSFQDPDDFREMLQDLERTPPQGVDDLFE